MTIRFACPHCQKTMKAPASYAGIVMNCPKCDQMLTVPAESTLEEPAAAAPSKPAAKPATAATPAPKTSPVEQPKRTVPRVSGTAPPRETPPTKPADGGAFPDKAAVADFKRGVRAQAAAESAAAETSAAVAAEATSKVSADKLPADKSATSKTATDKAAAQNKPVEAESTPVTKPQPAAAGPFEPRWYHSAWVEGWLTVIAASLVGMAAWLVPPAVPQWPTLAVQNRATTGPGVQVRVAADNRLVWQNKHYDDAGLLAQSLRQAGQNPVAVQLVIEDGALFGTVLRTVEALGRDQTRSIELTDAG